MFDTIKKYASFVWTVGSAALVVGSIVSGIVTYVSGAFDPFFQAITHLKELREGHENLEQKFETFTTSTDIRLDNFGRRMTIVEEISRELRPAEQIAEYDVFRSEVSEPCHIGEWCDASYRMQLTEIGETCQMIRYHAYIINHDGVPYPVEYSVSHMMAPSRTMTLVPFRFKMPSRPRPGPTEFYFRLDLDGCVFSPDKTATRHTERIAFHALPPLAVE